MPVTMENKCGLILGVANERSIAWGISKVLSDSGAEIALSYQNENLCLSGGCAQNSVANGKILDRTKFKNVYISSASGDAGGALGSASYFLSKKKIFLKKH